MIKASILVLEELKLFDRKELLSKNEWIRFILILWKHIAEIFDGHNSKKFHKYWLLVARQKLLDEFVWAGN